MNSEQKPLGLVCRICSSQGRSHDTGLRTCEDSLPMGDFVVRHCDACGNAFTYPDPSLSDYALLPDADDEKTISATTMLLHWFVRRRVAKLEKHLRSPAARILDIGGGACAFANAAMVRGHAVTVVEPNENNRTRAAEGHGVRFLAEFFSEELIERKILGESSFDAVTMWHSLEHAPHPAETLKGIHRVLKPGGVALISVPNIDSLLARLGGNYWTYLDVPHHLCHFNPNGLASLLNQAGLQPIWTYSFSAEYDVFGWYQTLLNVLSRSHNYYYNSRKKHRWDESYLRFPRWTKMLTACGPLLLPVVGIASLLTPIIGSPACVEIVVRKVSI